MKQRSLGKMLGLYLVTFGIYRLYWLVSTRRELIKKTDIKIPSILLLAIPYILLLAALGGMIYSFVDAEIARNNDVEACIANNTLDIAADVVREDCEVKIAIASGGLLYNVSIISIYVISIFIWPLIGWWYWKYSQAVEKVTNKQLSFPIAMLILLAVPDLFDMLIVQDSFNNIGETTKGVQQ